jgi:hypothetical protein
VVNDARLRAVDLPTIVGGLALACVAEFAVNWPSFIFFDRLVPGDRVDDMPVVGLAPYVLTLPLTIAVVWTLRRRGWRRGSTALVAALASALLMVLTNYLWVRATHLRAK